MKKWLPLFVISGIVFSFLIAIFLTFFFTSIFQISKSQRNGPETFLLQSISPQGDYILAAYRTNPGATVDFSIKVYLKNGEKQDLIYNAYHESQVDIFWLNNHIVSINGKTLDISRNERYDWRHQ